MKNVVIFFGGSSPERDVSVITGVMAANSLDKALFNPVPVYVAPSGSFYCGDALLNVEFYKTLDLKKCKRVTFVSGENKIYALNRNRVKELCSIDCAINCMHGVGGEDGTVCALMSLCRVPTASPPLFASSLSMDKHFTKIALKGLNIPSVDYVRVRRKGFFASSESVMRVISDKLGFPLVVKPACLGSSIGIAVVRDENEFFSALCTAFKYDGKAVCERYIEGSRDINCAAYYANGKVVVSEPEEALRTHDLLTFDDKYGGEKGGGGNRVFPAELPADVKALVKKYTAKIYSELEFCGAVRFDFLVVGGEVFVNEINAVPGSLAYYLFCDKISEFSDLLSELISEAERRKRESDGRMAEYSSSILSGDFKGVKK